MIPLLLVLLGGGGLWYLATHDKDDRTIWLVQGKRYNIVHRFAGAGWDASMYPGFCQFSQPVLTHPPGTGRMGSMAEVQFSAAWCRGNLQWTVPENIAISEV